MNNATFRPVIKRRNICYIVGKLMSDYTDKLDLNNVTAEQKAIVRRMIRLYDRHNFNMRTGLGNVQSNADGDNPAAKNLPVWIS